jgi:hypothetical protein
MYSISAERSAGWSGLAFLVCLVLSIVVPGAALPDIAGSPAAIAAFLSSHHQGLLISAWLGFPTMAFFLWFAVGVRAHLAHAAGVADGLPLYAITAAIIMPAIALVSSCVLTVLLLTSIPIDDLPGWWGLYMLLSVPLGAASVVFVFAAAHSMRRHSSASSALAFYGYLTALGNAASTFSIFSASGPMSLAGWVTLILGVGLFAIWVIATSVWLIRSAGASATVS